MTTITRTQYTYSIEELDENTDQVLAVVETNIPTRGMAGDICSRLYRIALLNNRDVYYKVIEHAEEVQIDCGNECQLPEYRRMPDSDFALLAATTEDMEAHGPFNAIVAHGQETEELAAVLHYAPGYTMYISEDEENFDCWFVTCRQGDMPPHDTVRFVSRETMVAYLKKSGWYEGWTLESRD